MERSQGLQGQGGPPQPQDEDFHIGLSMSGAISAGAYTAGVVDFLIQALQCWEDRRPARDVPDHRVGVKVISGASAGAITGALGVIALSDDRPPLTFPAGAPGEQKIKAFIPGLYETWVLKPSMIAPDGGMDLLSLQDLEPEKPGDPAPDVVSLLNAKLLTEIKDSALVVKRRSAKRPYVAAKLDVYMTVTNLRGVPFEIPFKTGAYGMMSHADRVHYRIAGLGAWDADSPFADADPFVPLDVANLFAPRQTGDAWDLYATAALASGAFPVGLSPRILAYPAEGYGKWKPPSVDAYRDPILAGSPINPTWPGDWPPGAAYSFTCVDGGMMNNDPFEYAHFSLMKSPPDPIDRASATATRAVIMIAPFPEAPELPPDGVPKTALTSIVAALTPALIQQARFKLSELVLAQSESVYSRFLVSPHRVTSSGAASAGAEKLEKFAIACGLLSGFGGFLDQAFRDHDFQLGRRNCQKFLRDSFAFPRNNAVVGAWSMLPFASQFDAGVDDKGQDCVQMIPLVGDAGLTVPAPQWPRMSADDLDRSLMPRIRTRLEAVLSRMVSKQPKWWVRNGLRIALWAGKQAILDFIRLSILADLVRRDQIDGWAFPAAWQAPPPAPIDADDIRAVLAQLVDPRFDLRNEAGLTKATKLDADVIRNILVMCQAETGKPYEVWQAPFTDAHGGRLFTLKTRKPGFFLLLPGVRQLRDWLSAPSVDPPGL